ncbi:RNA ligase (ATP) [Embleya scabrispora]|uniref:RNA ligase (ATP) n=1 Tax=Embleya scabrispora TaxID=159449 RepID=A0A1T3P549_9ACTN|nr:RNA ligase (ATP) [Embleya scabrispora]OPC84184.1 RNA ligase (ATP) [Embleya scabrispora]
MSTLRVTAERLTIHPHPNADALELAQVGLYRAVVPKGTYTTGDAALYIPEQAVVPDPLIAELGLTGRLAGPDHNRVRAIRLRGELSQGIVCRPASLAGVDLEAAAAAGTDFAERLGVTKWVPPIPVHMSGDVVPAPDLLRWIEIENIRRHPGLFTPGEHVIATEKIHGTACLYTHVAATGEGFVSSKGFGSKSLALVRNDHNLYWRTVLAHGVPEVAACIAKTLGAERVGIFGEVYGAGVQDLAYGVDAKQATPGYAVFDVALAHAEGRQWLSAHVLPSLLRWNGELPVVPRLYDGPYDEATLLGLAEGTETISGTSAHVREGIVVRPYYERHSPILGGRAIGKIVSEAYLTRKGGTEFE